ncbi:uncharacterized protein LOC111594458 [Drosophila hydei]|uniref:Uncharacterized protein LOC111594458 n=1 Tax=Drosophila hydei TaxID=7224 RepID=A0A6J1LJJ9_DROHY|nr:uncharacterized protein LOC111594458 [Drosophila hydei]XP_023163523.2 uncharacterized protein LOC111594458 [Drosophila hydei]
MHSMAAKWRTKSSGSSCRERSRGSSSSSSIRLPAWQQLLWLVCLTSLVGWVWAEDWSLSCASNCTCKWTNGKKSAICSSLQLTSIPNTLSTELQVLVLNDNHIPYLNREEFSALGLLNLQRIYLKKSEVQYIHKESFRNLKILVEIDLSDNKLEMLDKDTFMGNDRLRILYLNGNPLKRLSAYQFPILPHLRTLDMHDCLISYIDPMSLANLNLLEFLNLKNNLLESLSEYVFQHMGNLKTLSLEENPWQCNCKLRKFRNWYVGSRLSSVSLVCKGPPVQKDRTWDSVDDELFGCPPRVEIFNNEEATNIDIGSNTTFSCLVYGDPLPEVSWELNGKILDNDNVLFDTESITSDKLWSNLTVFNVSSLDAGTYACTGSNLIGSMTQNISIYLSEIVQHVLVKTPETFWYFGLIMGIFGTVFLLIAISFVVCLCKRTTRQHRHANKAGVKSSVSFNDQEKKLLDSSVTTTTNDRGDSYGIDNNPSSINKTDSTLGFNQIEIHAVESHRSGLAQQQQQQQQQVHAAGQGQAGQHMRQQLMTVKDPTCGLISVPTSMASYQHQHQLHSHSHSHGHGQMSEEFPLNVGVFPPPPEFCSNIVPNPTFGNIFIRVSVTQDMLDGADINMYPDLLNIPKRLQDVQCTADANAAGSSSSTTSDGQTVAQFATLPRHTTRRGILKKDSSLQPGAGAATAATNLYPHDEIVTYNLETGGYHCGGGGNSDMELPLPPPPPPPAVTAVVQCHHPTTAAPTMSAANCASCINNAPTSACSTPPIVEATPLRDSSAYPKYDNMGRRITASGGLGNSTLSLPDENETLFSETTADSNMTEAETTAQDHQHQLQHQHQHHHHQQMLQTTEPAPGMEKGNAGTGAGAGAGEFVSL